MNYIQGKLLKISVFFLLLIGCKPCNEYKFSDFKENIEIFNEVRKVIIKNKLLNSKTDAIYLNDLEKYLKDKDYQSLKNFGFKNTQKFQEVIVFKFSTKSNDNFLEKKIDNSLETNTTNKDCNYFLFFSENRENLLNIASFPRYAECRNSFKKIHKNWYYSSQVWYCGD